MAQQTILAGASAADHTGEDLHAAFAKCNAMFTELYALVGGGGTGRIAVTAASGTSNNVDPGSGFPTNCSWLDVDTTAGAAVWTGLKAGTDGQTVKIRVTAGAGLTLSTGGNGLGDSGSTAANQFTGEGDAGIPLYAIATITYRLLPTPTWAVG